VGLTGPHIGYTKPRCARLHDQLNGKAVKSYTMLRCRPTGKLSPSRAGTDGKLHTMQEAFWNQHGCNAACTPGMIIASSDSDRNPIERAGNTAA
jgi:aerobic-type carbon monoxide dehydrogenase small subunit (CoxS/CutS family)